MSSCFFSSRLKMRISRRPDARKRRTTALPNEPVPPVISRVLSANIVSGDASGGCVGCALYSARPRPEQKTVAADPLDEQQPARQRDRLVASHCCGLGLVAGGGEQLSPFALVAKTHADAERVGLQRRHQD